MRKSKFLLATLLFALASCGANEAASKQEMPSIDLDTYIAGDKNENSLGEFDLVSPGNALTLDDVTVFTWEECANAETYMLEVCSAEDFVKNVESVDYYSKENIKGTSFRVYSQFSLRGREYYWRVTAKNSKETRLSESVFTFTLLPPDVQEYKLDVGEADDWKLHPVGSKADIAIDNNNFFGNDEKSLKISFKKEDTLQGKPESDGWIVVTRTIERNIYGTDALFFNMYYAGQDSNIIIRLVDRDNEYWYCPVQTSINAKQTVVLKFDDFIQRKGDVFVGNQEFDYERIKYFEVVFEKTFGDGVLLMSGIKAIKFDNYRDEFLERINFDSFDPSKYVWDTYHFQYETTQDELTLHYYNNTADGHEKINGYGFLKLNLGCHIYGGDAVKVSVKYTGSIGSGANALIRIYEEDTDRWSYKIPYTSLVKDEYSTFVIPFRAFAKSAIQGDGKRQFYYIINLQFGLEKMYGTGTLSFKDFEIVKTKNYSTETVRQVADDGLIEDFSSYEYNADMFKIWTVSENNKDEYMDIYKGCKVIGNNNTVVGSFLYKCDMEAAVYYLPVETKNNEYKSLSLWLCDQSMRDTREGAMHVTNWNPDAIVYIRLVTGEVYAHVFSKLSPIWHEYNIPFTDFTLTNSSGGVVTKITPSYISHVGIAFQYYYKKADGVTPMPMYTDDNPVLIDNLYFTTDETSRSVIKEKMVSKDSNKHAYIDNFESYATNEDMLDSWAYSTSYGYEERMISTDVSASKGGTQSLRMQFRGNKDGNGKSPSYHVIPHVDSGITSKVLVIHLKSDVTANVYLNFYLRTSNTEYKYRASLLSVGTVWTEYVVPITKFILEDSSTTTSMGMNDVKNIARLAIGMDYNGDSTNHYVYIDNVYFDTTVTSYPTKIVATPLD